MAEVALLEPCISVQDLMFGVGQLTFDSRAEKTILPRAITGDKPLTLFRRVSLKFCIALC